MWQIELPVAGCRKTNVARWKLDGPRIWGSEENIPAGCSKRSSSKAAASEGPEAYPLGYVEGLNDARTTHGKRRVSARWGAAGEKSDFFSLLLETQETVVYNALDGEALVSLVE